MNTFKTPLLLSILLFLTLPAVAQAQFTYTTNTWDGTITITGYDCSAGALTIPETINGLPVTTIGDVFGLQGPFNGCTTLTSVTIPNSVTRIGYAAFEGCTSLASVTIGNSVEVIEALAFNQCTSLASVTIPKSVIAIVGTTGNQGLPFSNCSSLMAINVDPLNPSYSSVDGVLFDKSQTTLFQYPEAKPGGYTIPNSVTNVGAAFSDCTGLTSVTIPKSITSSGGAAFASCTSLMAITVDPLNPSYSSVDGVLFDKSQTTLFKYPRAKTGSYKIPNSVTSIGGAAFDSCTTLTSVTIPTSLTGIGDYLFIGCTSLTSVAIPNSVTSIGIAAFDSCTSLSSITIPDSVTSIGDSAFGFSGGLKQVQFQGNAPTLDGEAFTGTEEATVYYLPGTTGWSSTFGGLPTAQWVLPNPTILNNGSSFGAQTNDFGFTISWAMNRSIVVEASTSLTNPAWSPIGTNTLVSGSSHFSDPQWKQYPNRFYRLQSP